MELYVFLAQNRLRRFSPRSGVVAGNCLNTYCNHARSQMVPATSGKVRMCGAGGQYFREWNSEIGSDESHQLGFCVTKRGIDSGFGAGK
jgi:hypothetical protein